MQQRPAPPPRATHHRVRAGIRHHPTLALSASGRIRSRRRHGGPEGAQPSHPGATRRPEDGGPRLCASDRVQAPTCTDWPAIMAHAATGRADAAEHGHAPRRLVTTGHAWPAACSSEASRAEGGSGGGAAHRSFLPRALFRMPVSRLGEPWDICTHYCTRRSHRMP